MVTVLAALALLALGVAGTVVPADQVRELLANFDVPRDIQRLILDRQVAYACLLGSPALLIVGSILPGI